MSCSGDGNCCSTSSPCGVACPQCDVECVPFPFEVCTCTCEGTHDCTVHTDQTECENCLCTWTPDETLQDIIHPFGIVPFPR